MDVVRPSMVGRGGGVQGGYREGSDVTEVSREPRPKGLSVSFA